MLWNPPLTDDEAGLRASSLGEASRLMADLVQRGLRTLCFAKSRRAAELIHRFTPTASATTRSCRPTAPATARAAPRDRAAAASNTTSRGRRDITYVLLLFWGIDGVYTTAVGYMNGTTPTRPTRRSARAGPATPRRCWSPSTRPGSATRTCSRSSSRSTTRPRGCARATTSAPSTAPASTSPTTPRKRRRRWPRGLRRGPARGRPRADHDRGRARRPLLLRRGLPPAVPAQGAERLLRPGRHRRLLPHPRRGLLAAARPARRIASRAGDPLLRLLHRRLLRRHRHPRARRPRRLLAAALDRARVLRRAGPPRRRHDRRRACWSSRWSCSAR